MTALYYRCPPDKGEPCADHTAAVPLRSNRTLFKWGLPIFTQSETEEKLALPPSDP